MCAIQYIKNQNNWPIFDRDMLISDSQDQISIYMPNNFDILYWNLLIHFFKYSVLFAISNNIRIIKIGFIFIE